MGEWLALGLLVVPQLIVMEHSRMGSWRLLQTVTDMAATIECPGLRVLIHAELYNLYHDKEFISDYERRMDKGGFKDAKKAFKDRVDYFLASAAASHRRRRGFLQRRLEATLHLLSDCPGLFGPQWFAVVGVLAVARDEIIWYFRHRDLPALPSSVKVYKTRYDCGEPIAATLAPSVGDGGGGDVAVLTGAMMRLKALALRHAAVAQDYYRAYLSGALRDLLLQSAADVSPVDPMHALITHMADAAAQLAPGAESAQAFGLNAKRVLCAAASRGRKGAVAARSALPGNMARAMHAAHVVCDAVEGVRAAASLHALYYWRGMQWNEACKDALKRWPACAVLMLSALDDWTRDESALCRAQRCKDVGNESIQQTHELLRCLGDETTNQLHAIMQEEEREHSLGPLARVEHPHLAVAQLMTLLAVEQPFLRVFNHEFWPIEYIVSQVSRHVHRVVHDSLALARGGLAPRAALKQLQRYLFALRLVETHAAVPLQELVQQQLRTLFVHPTDSQHATFIEPLSLSPPQEGDSGFVADNIGRCDASPLSPIPPAPSHPLLPLQSSLPPVYLLASPLPVFPLPLLVLKHDGSDRWYVKELLVRGVHFVPDRHCFVSPSNNHVQSATSEPELRALCLLLGPAGVRSVERRLLGKVAELLKSIVAFMKNAAPVCKKVAGEDRDLFQGVVLARLAGCPGLAEFGWDVCHLGTLLHLRRDLHAALGVALHDATMPGLPVQGLPRALQQALRHSGTVLRESDTVRRDPCSSFVAPAGRDATRARAKYTRSRARVRG